MKTRHKCPRCGEYTDLKCYCSDCVAVLKKPSFNLRSQTVPFHREIRFQGKGV